MPARKSRVMRLNNALLDGRWIRYGVRDGDPARPPLLILNGLGANIELAEPFIDALFGPAVAIFDVPGVGGSPTPPSPYRPASIARLAAALLDHLGYAESDVLGVSWGGAIAQQFAIQFPERCRRLILAATATGALMIPGNPLALLKLATPRRYLDSQHAHRVAGEIYGGALRREPALVARTFRHIRFASRGGYYLQLAATFGWTSLPWLFKVRQRTLIMAGVDDPLVPTVNARIMQRLIPDARLAIIDCGHLFLVTRPAESARIVEAFLKNEDEPRRAA
jgi:poly(3-hydroxyalkanoate) depolymerase